jgi:hypothetical protein
MTMSLHTFYSGQAPTTLPPANVQPALRMLAVKALQAASAGLARMAMRLETTPHVEAEHCIELHAEAGALEGALYIDGCLVARLPGVRRL